MQIKRIAAGLFCAGLCLSATTACSGNGDASGSSQATQDSAVVSAKAKAVQLHKLTVRAPKDISEMTAVFLNTSTGKTANVKMEQTGGNNHEKNSVFSCEADANAYNMVRVKYGETESMDVAFNSFVSGWNLENDELLPYTVGTEPSYDPRFETKVFKFDGREKNIYIWTPDDYDKNSDKKYSVIYMFDGQSVLTTGKDRGMDNDIMCWNVSESVESMMAATDNKAIIVAIDNGSPYRDDELVPDLGHINMERDSSGAKEEDISLKRGSAFADFICDTIMPYVNESYHVYTDAAHTSIAAARWADWRRSTRLWRIPINSAQLAHCLLPLVCSPKKNGKASSATS